MTTPEKRLDRIERILGLFVLEGRRQRVQSREQNERINILIHMQERDREVRQAESQEINEKINILVDSQLDLSSTVKDLNSTVKDLSSTVNDLATAQSKTDKSLRAFLDSLRKGGNGNSSS
ncbi:MAG TPA: hypothetical protein VFI24_03585 [Pyrinomonadaceae bacterium]|nr:hypothetical protein [Pyrinomonadaceae bacterium]